MAIRSNSKSIDFTFDFETPNGASLSYPLRFHHTEDFGPSLSVLDENKEIAITFPATMFSEVYEFLIEQDIIETKVSKLSVPQPKSKPLSVPKPRPPFLAVPKSRVASSQPKPEPVQIDLGDAIEDDSTNEVDLIKAEEERIEYIKKSIDGATTIDSLSVKSQEEMDEETIQMINERNNKSSEIISARLSGQQSPSGKSIKRK